MGVISKFVISLPSSKNLEKVNDIESYSLFFFSDISLLPGKVSNWLLFDTVIADFRVKCSFISLQFVFIFSTTLLSSDSCKLYISESVEKSYVQKELKKKRSS